MYDIPIVDYDDDSRWGVLVGSGCGLMLAVMDHVPFRYCIDADVIPRTHAYALAQFITMANAAYDGGVALVGWFSTTDPEPLRQAFAVLDPPGLVYAGHVRLGVAGEVDTLQAFLDAAKRRWDPFVRVA